MKTLIVALLASLLYMVPVGAIAAECVKPAEAREHVTAPTAYLYGIITVPSSVQLIVDFYNSVPPVSDEKADSVVVFYMDGHPQAYVQAFFQGCLVFEGPMPQEMILPLVPQKAGRNA